MCHIRVESQVVAVEGRVANHLSHALPVGGRGPPGCLARLLLGQPEVTSADDDARHEPFEVPLPRRRCRLVEVVEVEHERALGRPEQPEVAEVRVATRDNLDARADPQREVVSHDRGGPAVEREGAREHPPHAQRHKAGQPCRVLLCQDRPRLALPRDEDRVFDVRLRLAERLSGSVELVAGWPRRAIALQAAEVCRHRGRPSSSGCRARARSGPVSREWVNAGSRNWRARPTVTTRCRTSPRESASQRRRKAAARSCCPRR